MVDRARRKVMFQKNNIISDSSDEDNEETQEMNQELKSKGIKISSSA